MNYLRRQSAAMLFLLLPAFAWAQTASELDVLLETRQVSAEAAARFTLGAAGMLPPELGGAEAREAAYRMARDRGWIKAEAGEAIKLRDAAFLAMGAFDLPGGLLYALFPGPRYAYREAVHMRIIQGRADPAMAVSGPRLLQIIGRASAHAEGGGL